MSKKYLIGIDLGGTNLKLALLDKNLKITAKNNVNTRSFPTRGKLIDGIALNVLSLLKIKRARLAEVLGVGVGVPGPTDAAKGIAHFFPNIPGWKNVPLKKILQKKLGILVLVDNDAKMMCLAEHLLGSAKGFKNVLCLTLGTGIGGGLILNGEIFRGADNAAGEFGHTPINENGPRCNCGGIACIESYLGNEKIIRQARQVFKRDIGLEELSLLAKNNDARAVRLWKEAGRKLGVALSGAVNLLNLDAVVLGGGVAGAGDVLFKEVRRTIHLRAMKVQSKRVKVLKGRLGSDAGLIGAGIAVKNSYRKVRG